MGALADIVLDHGYVPYKASADAARRILARADPGLRRPAGPGARRARPRRPHEPGPLVTARTRRALFERLPRLADLVPFVELADGLPTPVEQVDERCGSSATT